MELANRAGTTQRHVSFIESGRSVPGRTMVLRLAESLELPLRERNELLLAAGYAAAYPETPLDAAGLAPVREALRSILDGHLPYPAVVVDGGGGLVAANAAFVLLTLGADPELCRSGANMYRMALHPRGLAPRVVNLAAWGRHIVERLRRLEAEGRSGGGRERNRLVEELAGYVPTGPPVQGPYLGFAVPLELRSPWGELRLITTVTTFATAVDVTLAELKLEAFLPADGRTAGILHQQPWQQDQET
ncbi:helix-turn-helix domain-containing protein [Streptomyces lasalocidi]